MRLYRTQEILVIESKFIISILGFFSSGKRGYSDAKAAALFPFLIVKEKQYLTPLFIQHEKIHFRQQVETLYIGILLLDILETLYARLILKQSPLEAYLYRSSEQEAYRNQTNSSYLQNRQLFKFTKYLRDKKQLSFIKDRAPEVLIKN